MPSVETLIIAVLIVIAATLYASVGHGGASAYLAVMALFSVAPAQMKPAALVRSCTEMQVRFSPERQAA